MPNPNKNIGRKVEWHNGTAFAEVLAIVEAPNVSFGERAMLDTADLATLVSDPQPQIAGLRGPVSISFTVKFDKDDIVHAALLADFKSGIERQVKLTRTDATPSTSTWSKAVVQSFAEQGGGKDALALVAVSIAAWGTETEA